MESLTERRSLSGTTLPWSIYESEAPSAPKLKYTPMNHKTGNYPSLSLECDDTGGKGNPGRPKEGWVSPTAVLRMYAVNRRR